MTSYTLSRTIQLVEIPFQADQATDVSFRVKLAGDAQGGFEAADATQDDLNFKDPDNQLRWHRDVQGECAGVIRRRHATETYFLVLRATGSDSPVVTVTLTPHAPVRAIEHYGWRPRVDPYYAGGLVLVVLVLLGGYWYWRRSKLAQPEADPAPPHRALSFGDALAEVRTNVHSMNVASEARCKWDAFINSLATLAKK
jgi:hypothetical protein